MRKLSNELVAENDKECLEILDVLYAHFNRLSVQFQPINIIGVFFSDLVCYTTSTYLIRKSNYDYPEKISFPFLNSNYCKNPWALTEAELQPKIEKKGIGRRIAEKLCSLLSLVGRSKTTLLVASQVPESIFRIVMSNIRYFLIKFEKPEFEKYFSTNIDLEVSALRTCLVQVATKLGIQSSHFVDNFILYASLRCTKERFVPSGEVLLTGSLCRLRSRIRAANFMKAGKRVVSVCHSVYAHDVLSDPVFDYGEVGYCTDYLTFGRKRDVRVKAEAYSMIEKPNFHFRSSREVREVHIPNAAIKPLTSGPNETWCYVPTSFGGPELYGPYRGLEDMDYARWQSAILEGLENIVLKCHPKSKVKVPTLNVPVRTRVETANFQLCWEKYSVFVFDYFSTAFFLALASDRPVIYFNLGLRKADADVVELLKKRVFWFEINLSDSMQRQIESALNLIKSDSSEKHNLFSSLYSYDDKAGCSIDVKKMIYSPN